MGGRSGGGGGGGPAGVANAFRQQNPNAPAALTNKFPGGKQMAGPVGPGMTPENSNPVRPNQPSFLPQQGTAPGWVPRQPGMRAPQIETTGMANAATFGEGGMMLPWMRR